MAEISVSPKAAALIAKIEARPPIGGQPPPSTEAPPIVEAPGVPAGGPAPSAQTEAGLRQAIEYAEKVKAGTEQLPEDADEAAYWRSVAGIQSKLGQREQLGKIVAAPGQYVTAEGGPVDVEALKAQADVLLSPFVTQTDKGYQVNLVSALKAGYDVEQFKALGIEDIDIRDARGSVQAEKEERAGGVRFRAENVEVRPGYWISREDWSRLTPSQQGEVRASAKYDPVAKGWISRYTLTPAQERYAAITRDITSGAARSRQEAVGLREALTEKIRAGMVAPTFERWASGRGWTQEALVKLEPWDREQTLKDLQAVYKYEVGPLTLSERFTKWTVEKPYAAIGAVALPVLAVTAPTWATFALPALKFALPKAFQLGKLGFMGAAATTTVSGIAATVAGGPPRELDVSKYEAVDPSRVGDWVSIKALGGFTKRTPRDGAIDIQIDVAGLTKMYGEERAAAILAQAGAKPTIPLEIYERLGPSYQRLYTTTERRGLAYEPGIVGRYGRGVESLLGAPLRVFKPEDKPWYAPSVLAAGMYQYLVPHTLFSQLYREKGPAAAATLVPHFGPTFGYTALTWKEQTPIGRIAGIGFGLLPYATGPLGSVLRGAGRGISKVPVLGQVVMAPFRVARWAGEVTGVSPTLATMERFAPWQAAYSVGRAIPGYGPYATRRGWLGSTVPISQIWSQWGAQPVFGGRLVAPPRPPGTVEFGEEFAPVIPRSPFGRTGRTAFPGYREPLSARPAYFGASPEPPGIYASVSPSFPGLAGRLRFAVPRVALASAAVVTPLATLPVIPQLTRVVIPVVAVPVIPVDTSVSIDLSVVKALADEKVIGTDQQGQLSTLITQVVEQPTVTPRQYEVAVKDIVNQVLTPQQQEQFYKIQEQKIAQEQQITLETKQVTEITTQATIQQIVQQSSIYQQWQQITQQQQVQEEVVRRAEEAARQERITRQGIFPPIFPFGLPQLRVGGLGGGGGGIGGEGVFPRERGVWEFGRASLYLPGVAGPVRRPVRYGAVEPGRVRIKKKIGITGSRLDGATVGRSGRTFKPTVAF